MELMEGVYEEEMYEDGYDEEAGRWSSRDI